ncbi:hypothetical protein L7F22_008025 [Adiantum nelumboides]|nr:hypothetical protein [Adiantum nelumboides]
MLRKQAPNIFTLAEQEAIHNIGPFLLGKFLEALHYYSAIFDYMDATLPKTSQDRVKVEQLVFANEITNIVTCEEGKRVENHGKLDKRRQMMETMGFENVALSACNVVPAPPASCTTSRGIPLQLYEDRVHHPGVQRLLV